MEPVDTFPAPAPPPPEPIVTGFDAGCFAGRAREPIVDGFDAEVFAARFGAVDVFARVGGRLLSTGSNGFGRVDLAAALERTAGLPSGG